MKKQPLYLMTLLLTLATSTASFAGTQSSVSQAQTPPSETDSNRELHKLGAYLGLLGDPHPTVVGVNVAYNLSDMIRASVGFGKISASTSINMDQNGNVTTGDEQSMTTIGAACKFMVPGWNLTPSATLGYSHISLTDGFEITDYKSNNIYFGLGGDWQAASGFNLGAGLNVSLNGAAPSAPYMNVGVFF